MLNMTTLKICLLFGSCVTVPVCEASWLLQQKSVCVCVYVYDSLQHSLWISLLSEGGPNILTVQRSLPVVAQCKSVCVCVCCRNVFAGHWLPIHRLGIPRWKRYACVCVCVHREPDGHRWDAECWTIWLWCTGLPPPDNWGNFTPSLTITSNNVFPSNFGAAPHAMLNSLTPCYVPLSGLSLHCNDVPF